MDVTIFGQLTTNLLIEDIEIDVNIIFQPPLLLRFFPVHPFFQVFKS